MTNCLHRFTAACMVGQWSVHLFCGWPSQSGHFPTGGWPSDRLMNGWSMVSPSVLWMTQSEWPFSNRWMTKWQIDDKPEGDWISVPSPNFIAMATRVGPQHFAWFHWIGHLRKPPGRPKHLRSICHTSQLIGDFVQILGSKFWALGGLNQKSKNTFCRGGHEEVTAKNGSISSRNKKEESIWMSVTNRHTNIQTDRVNDKNSRLLG